MSNEMLPDIFFFFLYRVINSSQIKSAESKKEEVSNNTSEHVKRWKKFALNGTDFGRFQ
jgi:hypothetical protein